MAKQVARPVTVHHPETGEYVHLSPGEELPGWADANALNPLVFEGPEDPGPVPGFGQHSANFDADGNPATETDGGPTYGDPVKGGRRTKPTPPTDA